MCFTIKFHFSFFAYFRFKFFASLHFSNFFFEAKQSEAKFKCIFLLFSPFFHYFSHFFAFLRFFSLFSALNFSLCFDLVIFASKRNTAKQNSSLFFTFFAFLAFFTFFAYFRFASIFHLIFAYFTFIFASDFWCFASKWIMWNQAFFPLPSLNFKFRFRSKSEGSP